MQKVFAIVGERRKCKKHKTKAEKAIKKAARYVTARERRYRASLTIVQRDGSLTSLYTKTGMVDTIAVGRQADSIASIITEKDAVEKVIL